MKLYGISAVTVAVINNGVCGIVGVAVLLPYMMVIPIDFSLHKIWPSLAAGFLLGCGEIFLVKSALKGNMVGAFSVFTCSLLFTNEY